MKAFLDTSILVAIFYGDHEHHQASKELLLTHKKADVCTNVHCLAEVYSVLTGMPGKNRATTDEALLFLGSIRGRITIISLKAEDYFNVLESAASTGIVGGAIYDALLAHSAVKVSVETIYTLNYKHFARLGATVAAKLKTLS